MNVSVLSNGEVQAQLLIGHPRYRVDVWERLSPTSASGSLPAYRSHEFEIDDADAPEVIDWALNQVKKYRGGQVAVYLTVLMESDTCLVRIFGSDPTQILGDTDAG